MSGVGNVGANIKYCASWDGNGSSVRDVASFSLSLTPTYTFDAYLGCDSGARAMLASSGNWYVAAASFAGFEWSSLIQKVDRTQGRIFWVGLNRTLLNPINNGNFGWKEYNNCSLRVAGSTNKTARRLILSGFDCSLDPLSLLESVGP